MLMRDDFKLQESLVLFFIVIIFVAHCNADDAQMHLPAGFSDTNNTVHLSAQASIKRLLNGTTEQQHVAMHLYESLQNGALAGIYSVDHKLPALRGMWVGKRWQTLLNSKPARCLKQPQGPSPVIILGQDVLLNSDTLDTALLDAYQECGFRELNVIVKKQISDPYIPCVGKESSVFVYSPVTGVLVNPACRTDENGVCHLALPPAIYMFEVSCNGDPTSPEVIFRTIKTGDGIQTEGFNNLFWVPQHWDKFKTKN